MSERKLFTRRDFLACLGVGVSTVAVDSLVNQIPKFRLKDKAEYPRSIEAQVIKHGEDEEFDYRGIRVKAKVNEEAFVQTLIGIAQEKGDLNIVLNYLEKEPLSIALSKEVPEQVYAQFNYRSKEGAGTLEFPTKFLKDYLDSQVLNDEQFQLAIDQSVIHETIHLWQFITRDSSIYIDEALGLAYTYALMTGGAITGYNGYKMYIEKNGDQNLKHEIGSIVSGQLAGGGLGQIIHNKVPMDSIEVPARRWSEELVDKDYFQNFRGKYFHFKKVTEEDYP